MARQQSDREDLLREATALVERAELKVAGFDEPIIVGFRRGGAASFFFGSDPVYQFSAAGELRRAFVAGCLVKAEQGRLVRLSRERSAAAVTLVRDELDAREQAELLAAAEAKLRRLAAALAAGDFKLIGQVPADSDIVERVRQWFDARPGEISVALVPNVR